MVLLVSASKATVEADFQCTELNSAHVVASDDEKIASSSVVQDLVSERYDKKLEELRARRSRRSTTKSSSLISSSRSSEEINDEVFAPVVRESTTNATSVTPEGEHAGGTVRSVTSVWFGEVIRLPAPDPEAQSLALSEIIANDDDAAEISAAAAKFPFWFCNKNQSQKCWPRREDVERKAAVIFNTLYRQKQQINNAVHNRRPIEESCHSYIFGPGPSCDVEEIISTIQNLYYKSKQLDKFCKMELRDLLNDAYLENKMQMCAPPRFLVIDSLQIFAIQVVSSTEMPVPNSRCYTFGILDCDKEIRTTEVQESESEQVVSFDSEHSFRHLPFDFEIRLKFFQSCIEGPSPNEGSKYLMTCFNQSEAEDEEPIRFDSIGEATLSCEHLMNGHLTHVHSSEFGRLLITAKVTADVRSQLTLRQYLYYASTEKNPTVGWTNKKRWCKLEHTFIKMWLSQEMTEEPPVKSIDLAKVRCVRRALPEENPRQYSMVMEIVQDHRVIKYFLAHAQQEVVTLWIEIIKIVKAATESFVIDD